MERKEILLDMAGCASVAQLHERLRVAFRFPAYYGANLDALWDMGCDLISAGEVVRIKGVHTMPAELQAYFSEKIMAVLRDIAKEKEQVSFTVED